MKFLVAPLLALLPLLACDTSQSETPPPGAEARAAGTAVAEAAPPASHATGLIRNVRVTPAETTVRISFTGVSGAFATVIIGATPPAVMPLPALLAAESAAAGGVTEVYVMDPERQVAGYLLRSRGDQYQLDTATDQPEEGSTNGPVTLRPGATYHFVITVPPRPARPGEDEDDLPPGEQYAGIFTTGR